jgi:hypothetical protein
MINTYVCFEVRFEVMQQALRRSRFCGTSAPSRHESSGQ